MVEVAQLVESRIVIPVVAGSSPVFHPKILETLVQEANVRRGNSRLFLILV